MMKSILIVKNFFVLFCLFFVFFFKQWASVEVINFQILSIIYKVVKAGRKIFRFLVGDPTWGRCTCTEKLPSLPGSCVCCDEVLELDYGKSILISTCAFAFWHASRIICGNPQSCTWNRKQFRWIFNLKILNLRV